MAQLWNVKIDRSVRRKQNRHLIVEAASYDEVESIVRPTLKPGDEIDVVFKPDLVILRNDLQ